MPPKVYWLFYLHPSNRNASVTNTDVIVAGIGLAGAPNARVCYYLTYSFGVGDLFVFLTFD